MTSVTLSAHNAIVLPEPVREILRLSPGDALEVVTHEDRIELIPVRSLKSFRGMLRGLDTHVMREKDRI